MATPGPKPIVKLISIYEAHPDSDNEDPQWAFDVTFSIEFDGRSFFGIPSGAGSVKATFSGVAGVVENSEGEGWELGNDFDEGPSEHYDRYWAFMRYAGSIVDKDPDWCSTQFLIAANELLKKSVAPNEA